MAKAYNPQREYLVERGYSREELNNMTRREIRELYEKVVASEKQQSASEETPAVIEWDGFGVAPPLAPTPVGDENAAQQEALNSKQQEIARLWLESRSPGITTDMSPDDYIDTAMQTGLTQTTLDNLASQYDWGMNEWGGFGLTPVTPETPLDQPPAWQNIGGLEYLIDPDTGQVLDQRYSQPEGEAPQREGFYTDWNPQTGRYEYTQNPYYRPTYEFSGMPWDVWAQSGLAGSEYMAPAERQAAWNDYLSWAQDPANFWEVSAMNQQLQQAGADISAQQRATVSPEIANYFQGMIPGMYGSDIVGGNYEMSATPTWGNLQKLSSSNQAQFRDIYEGLGYDWQDLINKSYETQPPIARTGLTYGSR